MRWTQAVGSSVEMMLARHTMRSISTCDRSVLARIKTLRTVRCGLLLHTSGQSL